MALLAASPGPDNIYVAVVSLSYGTQKGIMTILGLMTGCIIHTMLIAFGFSVLISQNDMIFQGIKIAGAFYLFYLAYQTFKTDAVINFKSSEENKNQFEYYKKGFLMNLLNPKVSLFFLAFFPGFLFNDQLSESMQFLILGGIFIVVSFIIFLIIALLASKISTAIQPSGRSVHFFKWLQIVVFCGIGIFILISKK